MHAMMMVLIDTLNLLVYRTFLDNRCKDHRLQPRNWKEWNYVHKKVDNGTSDSDTHNISVTVFTCIQDQPLQTNRYDCGVFASQVNT